MTAIEFLCDVAVSGKIMGVGIGSSVGEIRAALGEQCVVDRQKRSLRIDYGLVEFGLYSDVCESYSVQLHRLAGGFERMIPDVLVPPLSGMAATVSFAEFRDEVERRRYSFDELGPQANYNQFRIVGTHTVVTTVNTADDDELPASGDIWSIAIAGAG